MLYPEISNNERDVNWRLLLKSRAERLRITRRKMRKFRKRAARG